MFSKWDNKRQQFFCLYYSIVGRGFLIPPTLPGPIVFQILSNPPLLATTTALFVTLFLWQNGSTHAKPWYLGTRRNLMCAFSTRFQVYWCLKLNVVYIYIYILTPQVMCSQFADIKNLIPTMPLLFKNCCLAEVKSYICWLNSIMVSSSHETQTILMEMV